MNVTFKKWKCKLNKTKYGNNRVALTLTDAEDGSPVATASVNLPNQPLGDDEIFIKDYSENQGILNTLVDANVVSPPFDVVVTGMVVVDKCKLLI